MGTDPIPCAWCKTPTVKARWPHGNTRGYRAPDGTDGELCPRCARKSYEYEDGAM